MSGAGGAVKGETVPGGEDKDMVIEYVKDLSGNSLKLQVVDSRYYPTFPTHVIKNMKSIKIRSNDVILAGYLKAGTHWVWEIMRMLLAGTTDVINVEKDQCMMEQTDQKVLDSLPSPRVLNSHVLFERLPAEVLVVKPKIVYLTRNPKDTVIAMYHHHRKLWDYYYYNGSFDDYLYLFMEGKVDYGSWFDHIKNWSDAAKQYPDMDILEINYEDLTEHTTEQISRLAAFLGLSPSQELVQKIEEVCSLDAMRDRKGKFDLCPKGTAIMYRKGKVGDWTNTFTEAQNTWFDEKYNSKMASIQTHFHWRFQSDSA